MCCHKGTVTMSSFCQSMTILHANYTPSDIEILYIYIFTFILITYFLILDTWWLPLFSIVSHSKNVKRMCFILKIRFRIISNVNMLLLLLLQAGCRLLGCLTGLYNIITTSRLHGYQAVSLASTTLLLQAGCTTIRLSHWSLQHQYYMQFARLSGCLTGLYNIITTSRLHDYQAVSLASTTLLLYVYASQAVFRITTTSNLHAPQAVSNNITTTYAWVNHDI